MKKTLAKLWLVTLAFALIYGLCLLPAAFWVAMAILGGAGVLIFLTITAVMIVFPSTAARSEYRTGPG